MLPTARTIQALIQTQSSQPTTLPKLQSPWLKLPQSNPKLHHAQSWLCAVMTAQAKSVPKPPPLAVVAMASPAASLVTSQALAVTASQAAMVDVMVAAKALHRAAHVWVMQLSVLNALLWSLPKMPCVVWLHKRTARC
jgi:hypothetical protein